MNYVALEIGLGENPQKQAFGDLTSIDEDVTDKVCKFIFSEKFRGYTFLAHNAKGYDAQPIQRWLETQSIDPKTLFRGRKIMQIIETKLNIRIHDTIYIWKGVFENRKKRGD